MKQFTADFLPAAALGLLFSICATPSYSADYFWGRATGGGAASYQAPTGDDLSGVSRTAATDCTAETGGITKEVCYELDDNTLYVCESGPCNGSGWVEYGGGDVVKVGTPVDGQIAVWTGDGTVEGSPELTYEYHTLAIEDADITIPRPGTTNTWFQIYEWGSGGAAIQSYIEDDDHALYWEGFTGSTSPTKPVFLWEVDKSNGSTGYADLADSEIAWRLTNNGSSNLLTIYGNGDQEISGGLTVADGNGAAPTTDGQIKYDRTTERLQVGDGSGTSEFVKAGTLTDTKYCTYDATGKDINCNSDGGGDVVSDTTPQLGGDLDVNGHSIVSASAGNIAITPDTTGDIVLDGLNWPQADGSADQILKTDGSGQLAWVDPPSGTATDIDQYDIACRMSAGTGAYAGCAPGDLSADGSPGSGHYLLIWDGSGVLSKIDYASLPSGGGGGAQVLSWAVTNQFSPIASGDESGIFTTTAYTLDDVMCCLVGAPTGSGTTIDIQEAGTTVLSTAITIDDGENCGGSSGTQGTAATAAVVSDSSLAAAAYITAEVTGEAATTQGSGLQCYLTVE